MITFRVFHNNQGFKLILFKFWLLGKLCVKMEHFQGVKLITGVVRRLPTQDNV